MIRKIAIMILFVLSLISFFSNINFAKDVSVKGYYRKDGTYVRPHHRSSPDEYKWNNYGSPSYEQRQQYKDYNELPSYQYDYDSDGIQNRYDYDDDNDGVNDDNDSNPYNKLKTSEYKYNTLEEPNLHQNQQPIYQNSDVSNDDQEQDDSD